MINCICRNKGIVDLSIWIDYLHKSTRAQTDNIVAAAYFNIVFVDNGNVYELT